jgi:tRNA dimethylallyltransferase
VTTIDEVMREIAGSERPAAVLIAGPTASGKSALALRLADELGGVIINADSMQVYAGLRVLTARPDAADEARTPHRLYGHVPVAQAYSVAQWLADVAGELAAAQRNGRVAIIVGGTGLYFKALTEGLSPVPEIAPDIRMRWREAGERISAADLHYLLAARDAETAAALRPSDKQRIVRALEVLEATGRPLVEWQRIPGTPLVAPQDTRRLVVQMDRDRLYERADQRFRDMVETGALEEVGALVALGLEPALPAMRALGVAPLARHLAGEISLEEAIAVGQRDTRHYIRRQSTWLRRYMIAWKTASAQ